MIIVYIIVVENTQWSYPVSTHSYVRNCIVDWNTSCNWCKLWVHNNAEW